MPSADQYPAAVLSNQSGVHVGATLLVLAAVGLIWFAGGLRARIGSRHQLDVVPVIAISGVVILLILQAGLTVASLDFAEQAPDTSWNLHKLSGALGFESFMTSLLGGMALAALVVTADRSSVSTWFWWFTVAFAAILTVGGLLEGVGATPDGRFSILFGLWAFVAAFALQAGPAEDISN